MGSAPFNHPYNNLRGGTLTSIGGERSYPYKAPHQHVKLPDGPLGLAKQPAVSYR